MKEKKSLPPRTAFRQKIALVLFGLFLFFVLLEVGLRLAGFIMLSMQDYRNKLSFNHTGTYKILCLGESTTQGQYPPFLEEVLNQHNIGISFSVIDKGRASTNTSVILSQVESYLDQYHPDMVVAMMGVNDGGAHMPYEYPSSSISLRFLRSFKIYKLSRLLWLHMVTKAQEIKLSFVKQKGAPAKQTQDASLEHVLKESLKLNPKNDQAYLWLGWFYHDQGQLLQAEECFKKAMELNPRNDQTYLRLGCVYHDQGQLLQAEECFKKAMELNPRNDQAYLLLGWLYLRQGQPLKSEQCFKKALELNPSNDQAYLGLGWFYHNQGQLLQAGECFNKALELNPRNDQAYLKLGWFYHYQGQPSKAEECFKKALELNSRNDGAYLGLGCIYHDQGQPLKAEECLKKGLALNPSSAQLYGALAVIYKATGQAARAQEYYDKASELELSWYKLITVKNYHALEEILNRRKIRLVCVEYPMRSIEPLKKTFEDNTDGVIFVDNERSFRDAVGKSSYKEYFRDMFGGEFGHCTDKGNRLLAENIANVILKEVFNK